MIFEEEEMGVVVVEKNSKGKIELTKEELQKMLDDAYSQGKNDACKTCNPWCVRYDTLTVPSWKVTCGDMYTTHYLSGISNTAQANND